MSTTEPDERITIYNPVVATTEFAARFPVFDNDDIKVYVNGEERSNFAVSATYTDGISNNAKAVFATGVTGKVEVVGERDPRRQNRFGPGPLPPRDLNLALDTIESEVQELSRDVSRAVKAAFDEDSQDLPEPAPGKSLGWSTSGLLTNYTLVSGDGVAFGASGLDLAQSATPKEARDAIDFEEALDTYLFGKVGDAPAPVQKLMMICDDGSIASPIFAGAKNTPQGGCVIVVDGTEYAFLLVRVSGATSWGSDETFRIVQYELAEDGSIVAPTAYSQELLLGHQPLSGYVDDGQVYLITGQQATGVYVDDEAGKGFCRIAWNGADTDQADVENIPLFGLSGSGHPYASFSKATPFLSADGKYLHLWANDTKLPVDDTAHTLFTYDFNSIMALSDPLDARPLFPLGAVNGPARENAYFLQGGAGSGRAVYAARGYFPPFGYHGLQIFDLSGRPRGEIEFDDCRARYTSSQLLNHATLGNPTQMEVEGVCLRSNGELLVFVQESWRAGCPVVTEDGSNWASIASGNVGNPPSRSPLHWVRTTKAATAGAYNGATVYGTGVYSQRQKLIYSIRVARGEDGEEPLSTGEQARGSGATLRLGGNTGDLSFPLGDNLQFTAYSEQTGKSYEAFGLYGGFSWRFHDLRYGSTPEKYVNYGADFSSGREFLLIRVNGSMELGAGANAYGKNDSSFPGAWRFWSCKVDGSSVEFLSFSAELDRYTRLRKVEQILVSDAARAAHTGNTTETTLKTYIIPGRALGPNGYLEIDLLTSQTNSANNKTVKVKLNGVDIINSTAGFTDSASTWRTAKVRNRGSENSQVFAGPTAAAGLGESTVPVATATIDTSVDMTLTITATLTSTGETVAVESVDIRSCYV